ncbi:putative endopeptidase Clp [Helianthus annuus]|nr:putative endopeptidase Clp [Helianthus annuus]KAJ0883535.1 putative endopeptidase Clp [Helianthus annuus]
MKKRKSIRIYILIFFFEPYASKGACTVPKGYNLTIINRLYRERLLFLGQEVDNLYLFINSLGGWVILGVALYDTMQFVQPDVHTICKGSATSMGSFMLVGRQITKRLAFPHAWHQ